MNNVIDIRKAKQIPDTVCGHCGKQVLRSTWKAESSWSWFCKDDGAIHGPLLVGDKPINAFMNESEWLGEL